MKSISEYQYLRSLAFWQYEAKMQEQVETIQEQILEAIKEGNYDRAMMLESERASLAVRVFDERVRAEEIIYWLELDSLFRLEGRSFPDMFEELSAVIPRINLEEVA